MTHIDPFAPADSPQHPSNWRVAPRGEEQAVPIGDAMPLFIRLDDEPVAQGNPDASIIGHARWEEYRLLLDDYGTDEQQARMDVRTPLLDDEDMPTLAEMREKRVLADAAIQGAIDHPPVNDEDPKDQTGELVEVQPLADKPGPKPAKTRAAKGDDLAAKLAALKDAGL